MQTPEDYIYCSKFSTYPTSTYYIFTAEQTAMYIALNAFNKEVLSCPEELKIFVPSTIFTCWKQKDPEGRHKRPWYLPDRA